MKAFTAIEMLRIVIILVVLGVGGYMFGIHTLFLHNSYEVLWYMLYVGGGFAIYNIVAWTVDFFSGKEIVDAKNTTASKAKTAS